MDKPRIPFHYNFKYIHSYIYGVLLLTLILPLTYSKLLANGTDLPRDTLTLLIALLSTISFLGYFYKKAKFSFNKIFLFIFICFIWAAISLLWSNDFGNSLIEITRYFSSLLILFLAMQIKFYKQQVFVLNMAVVGLFLITLIGLLQAFGFSPFSIHYLGRPAATFINPNHASIYIEFFIPVLLILILVRKNNKLKTFYSVSLGAALSFLFVLSSFGTLISLLLALTIAATILSKHINIYSKIKSNKRYLTIISISMIILISSHTLMPSSSSTEKQTKAISLITQKSSHKIRLGLYSKSIEAAIDNPLFGFGYGGFRAGILPYISEIQSITNHNEHLYFTETHNDFIQQFTETGLIGGTLFVVFFIMVLFLGLNALKSKRLSEKNIFIFSISSGLLVLILHAFIDFPFHLSASNFLIYLTSGFILSHTAKTITFKKNINIKIVTILILIALFLFLLISIYYNNDYIKSNKLIRDTAIALHKEKNCNKAVRLIDESNQLFKFDFQSQASQAQIYGVCPQNLTKQQKVISQLVELNPTNFRARMLRGNLSLINNDSVSAFKDYFYVVRMLPNSAIGYIGLGKWAIKLNKLRDAHNYFEKANILEPNNLEVNYYLKQLSEKAS